MNADQVAAAAAHVDRLEEIKAMHGTMQARHQALTDWADEVAALLDRFLADAARAVTRKVSKTKEA